MRRLFVILISFLLLVSLTLPALAWESLPEGVEPIITDWVPRFTYYNITSSAWFSRSRSPSNDYWNSNSTDVGSSDSNQLVPSIIFSDSTLSSFYYLEGNTTYYLDFTYNANLALGEWLDFSTNPNTWYLVPFDNISTIYGDLSNSLVTIPQPDVNLMYKLSTLTTDISITNTMVDTLNVRIRVAFRTNNQVDQLALSGLYMPFSAISESKGNFTINQFAGWTDPDGGTFDTVVVEGLLNINNSLEDINNSVESFREDVNNSLVGDPSDYPDNSGVGDAAEDLIDKEEEINDLIYTPVTMPDGTVINVDSNTINNFREYIYSTYDPIDYDSSAGSELAKIFETFMPYVGVVVFLNLMLGAVLAFLRGRANA